MQGLNLSLNEYENRVAKFAEEKKAGYPVLFGDEGQIAGVECVNMAG